MFKKIANKLRNLKVVQKLSLSMLALLAIMFVIGVMGLRGLSILEKADSRLYEKMTVPLGIIGDISGKFHNMQVTLQQLLESPKEEDRTALADKLNTNHTAIIVLMDQYQKTVANRTDSEMFDNFSAELGKYWIVFDKVVEAGKSGQTVLAKALLASDEKVARESLVSQMEIEIAYLIQKAKFCSVHNIINADRARWEMSILLFLGIMAALLLSWVLGQNFRKTLNVLLAEMKTLGDAGVQGRLDVRAKLEDIHPEFKPIAAGFNDTLDAIVLPVYIAATYIDQISKGDMPEKITDDFAGDFDVIKQNLNRCIDAINGLIQDADMLANAAIEGRLDTRADAGSHEGAYGRLIEGVNDTMDTLVSFINVMPVPAVIIDNDFNFLYINQTVIQLLGLPKDQILGSKCYDHFKTSDCRTDKCACGLAMQGDRVCSSETDAHPGGLDLEISYTGVPIKDLQGKTIGCFEVITDQTAIKNAMKVANKNNEFQRGEVQNLVEMLGYLSNGNLDFTASVAEGDADTAEAQKSFVAIAEAINISVTTIKQLVKDVEFLTQSALDGNLEARADATGHKGEFSKIVEGFNKTLDLFVGPLEEAGKVLKNAAEKDLTKRVEGIYFGELAEFKDNVNNLLQSLDATLFNVTDTIQQVASGSNQVAAASQSQAQGATEQSSALVEINASISQFSNQTKTNSDSANQANSLSKTARTLAESGQAKMYEMSKAMSEISESSTQIGKIIKVIDEIAFQTNLLALNAAVEAARAGKHGKGFAVVADEVRNLAGRSAKAAKETADLIESAKNKVMFGNDIAIEASSSFGEIVDGIIRVTDIVGEISAASKEQLQGVQQLTQAIHQIDQVTQSNAAGAEETAASSEELSSQSMALESLINQFKLTSSKPVSNHLSEQSKAVNNKSVHRVSQTKAILLDDTDFGKF